MVNPEDTNPKISLTASIQNRLDQMVSKMASPTYKPAHVKHVIEVISDLIKFHVKGIQPFIAKLAQRVGNKDELFDILVEGRFAVVLAKNGFTDIYLELTKSGPDINAVYEGDVVYFEVTRRRSSFDEWDECNKEDLKNLESDSTENINTRILKKVKQLHVGTINIVVQWSNTFGLDNTDLQKALEYVDQEINADPYKYSELSGVLYSNGGVDHSSLQQFYLYMNKHACSPVPPALAYKLETMTELDIAVLKEKREGWDEVLKRIHARPQLK